jgi:hypothetical protein
MVKWPRSLKKNWAQDRGDIEADPASAIGQTVVRIAFKTLRERRPECRRRRRHPGGAAEQFRV